MNARKRRAAAGERRRPVDVMAIVAGLLLITTCVIGLLVQGAELTSVLSISRVQHAVSGAVMIVSAFGLLWAHGRLRERPAWTIEQQLAAVLSVPLLVVGGVLAFQAAANEPLMSASLTVHAGWVLIGAAAIWAVQAFASGRIGWSTLALSAVPVALIAIRDIPTASWTAAAVVAGPGVLWMYLWARAARLFPKPSARIRAWKGALARAIVVSLSLACVFLPVGEIPDAAQPVLWASVLGLGAIFWSMSTHPLPLLALTVPAAQLVFWTIARDSLTDAWIVGVIGVAGAALLTFGVLRSVRSSPPPDLPEHILQMYPELADPGRRDADAPTRPAAHHYWGSGDPDGV